MFNPFCETPNITPPLAMSDDKEKSFALEELKRMSMERKANSMVLQFVFAASCEIAPRERSGTMRCLKAYFELIDSLRDCIDQLAEYEIGNGCKLEPPMLAIADELESMTQQMVATLHERFPDLKKTIAEIRQNLKSESVEDDK